MSAFAPGEIMFTVERMGDDKNTMEIREVFYMRDPDGECRWPHNVKVARLGIVQGDPTHEDVVAGGRPRYARWGEPSRDPGEADGRTMCRPLGDCSASVWARIYHKELGLAERLA